MPQAAPEELLEQIRQGNSSVVLTKLERDPELMQAQTAEGASLVSYALYNRQAALAAAIAARSEKLNICDAAALGDAASVETALKSEPALADSHSPDGFPIVALAAFFGHAPILDLLIGAGADVNRQATNAFRVNALHAAVSRQDLGLVEKVLDAGADPNLKQQNGFTPLHAAAGAGNVALLNLLLQRGADPALKDDSGKTAEQVAAGRGHENAVSALKGLEQKKER